MSCFSRPLFAPMSALTASAWTEQTVPTAGGTHSTAIRTRECESQVVEGRNCPTSGSPAEGCAINLGETPGALRGPSRAAPSKGATCEGEGSIWKPKGSASKSEGYGSRGEALPEYYRDKTAAGSRAVPASRGTSGSRVVHAMCDPEHRERTLAVMGANSGSPGTEKYWLRLGDGQNTLAA